MKKIIKILFFLFSFFISTALIKAQNYDYLIIAPDVFMQNATWDDDLLNLQTSRGFQPVIEDVSVYTTAEQIKGIIYSYYNNNPIKYVLLMGNGKNLEDPNAPPDTSVPYGYLQHGIVNPQVDYLNGTYIPFFSVESNNPWEPSGIEDVATDDPYVSDLTTHGPVYIGRVPVISITEANDYVDKLEAYYQALSIYSEAFNREILLNIDITTPSGSCTAELVTQINDELVNEHIPTSTSIVELNVSEHNDCPSQQPYTYCQQRQNLFKSTLNQGAAIISILATSGGPESFGGWFWAYDNTGQLPHPEITFNDLNNKNTGMPFLIAPNCHQGEINNPDGFESTMRKLMVYNNGGIIGAIAPTVGSEQHENGYVLYRFHDLIFQNETMTYGEIFKVLKEEMFANFAWLEFYNNGLTYFGDPSLVPSIYKHRSGTIASSQTWSGNFVIDNSVTIASGRSLTLLQGTNLFFTGNSSIEAVGTLTAIGTLTSKTSFNKAGTSGTWGSIIFNGSTSSNSILDNVEIKNSTSVMCLNSADVDIQHSKMENCTYGVYIYNSQPQIIGNEILEPYGNGVYGEASGKSPLIKQNKIKKVTNNLYNFQGVYLQNYTNPFIVENDIQGFAYGIYYGGGGSGNLTDADFTTPTKNNRLVNNNIGLTVAWGSYLIAGSTKSPIRGKNNSIYGNTSYDATAYQSGNILATRNWWGTDGAQVYSYSNGYINATVPLTSDPWAGIPLRPIEEEIVSDIPIIDSIYFADILTGLSLESQGRIEEAIIHYKRMIMNLSHPKFGLVRLVGIKNRYSINNIQNYLETLLNGNLSYKATVLNLVAGIYLSDRRYEEAMQLYNLIITGYPSSFEATNAMFEKFFAALHYANDLNLASQLLSQLQSLNITDEDFLMRLGTAEFMLNGASSNKLFKGGVANSENNEINLPMEYSLLGNYPNPFNPTTTISYALPFQSSVELVIFDIMGREIKTFNVPSQSSGYQNIIWDGTNENGNSVASGIYLYRLNLKSLENNEVFVKTAKLMMLK